MTARVVACEVCLTLFECQNNRSCWCNALITGDDDEPLIDFDDCICPDHLARFLKGEAFPERTEA